MNANAKIPAVINANGIPFIFLGVSAISNCSLQPAKIINANAKPTAVKNAYTKAPPKL